MNNPSFAAALKAAHEAATPGPWQYGYDDESGRADGLDGGSILGVREGFVDIARYRDVVRGGRDDWGVPHGVLKDADANLIVLLRNAVPEIVALLKALDDMRGEQLSLPVIRALDALNEKVRA